MILRIDEESDGETTILRLIGRIESDHLPSLESQVDGDARTVVLDLTDVKLVDLTAVRFLRSCEESGVKLQNCPPYIREWILLDRQTDRGVD